MIDVRYILIETDPTGTVTKTPIVDSILPTELPFVNVGDLISDENGNIYIVSYFIHNQREYFSRVSADKMTVLRYVCDVYIEREEDNYDGA